MYLKSNPGPQRLLCVCLLAATILVPGLLRAQRPYWQQQVNYRIDVTLNDQEHSLDAFETLVYTNNSPDTLTYIWFHLWPNAFKNDKTAFSDQLLVNNRTDFYFSDKAQRGYINRLAFRVNTVTARMEDHPRYIDVVKVVLPEPLPPKGAATITTPFHVQLPYNFSRGGHEKQSYQVTQWYPKPAVYDRDGWHPMPYLDQGEFYSEFGNFDVRITLPAAYTVAATGQLQNEAELAWLKKKAAGALPEPPVSQPAGKKQPVVKKRTTAPVRKPTIPRTPGTVTAAASGTRSLHYLQNNVHDFAWFADKQFVVQYDTLALASGRVVDVFSFCLPAGVKYWKNSIRYIKDAVIARSAWLGEYPYNTVSAVEAKMGVNGGMEYPTITSISPAAGETELKRVIEHEVGHNWLYGILATNERTYPWMDEGMNTFYDQRSAAGDKAGTRGGLAAGMLEFILFETLASLHKDQPINTPSPAFTAAGYGLVAYYKAAHWMQQLENMLGRKLFDSGMQTYYSQWQFKHPAPSDFKQVMETVSRKNLDSLFNSLNTTGSLLPPVKKAVRIVPFAKLRGTEKNHYIGIAPAIGGNAYDGFMIGGLVHNYQLPLPHLQFMAAPLYATRSRQLNGLARVAYSWYPGNSLYRVDAGIGASTFSMNEYQPENGQRLFTRFSKVAPVVRLTLREASPLSKVERYVQFKTFLIREGNFDFRQVTSGTDTVETVSVVAQNRVLNQLKAVVANTRVLYPYRAELQLEQQRGFIRAALTGNYFFNYASNKGGMQARIFAGKFFYTGASTLVKQLNTDRYHLNLSGPNGYEDYTYSNYFAGRNRFEGWSSQQLMMRDGGFKVRTELLSSKVGKTDNWLIAGNLATDIPDNINPLRVLPFAIPIKVFADIGTYAEAWDKNAENGKFLFDAGLQLSLFKQTVNIYIPVVFSSVFKDYYRSVYSNNRFWRTITFSIDIQDFTLKKIDRNIPW